MRTFGILLAFAFAAHFIPAEAQNQQKPLLTKNEIKLYFKTENIVIDDNAIFVSISDDWIETNVIRSDEQGLYVNVEDVREGGSRVQPNPNYKCPYCFHPTPLGEKCKRKDCPKNLWKKKKEENS